MKRRDFLKVVTGFVAGAVAFALPSKKVRKGLPVQPRESFETFKNLNEFDYGNIEPNSANIDPNSEWAKQKPFTLAEVEKTEKATHPPMFYKEVQFGEPFSGKIVSMCTFQGELWVATEREVYRIKERTKQYIG